jgi:glyoxalase family protein
VTRPPSTAGLHHVSVITGTAAQTVSFYAEVLGLRFVKQTVNYDDPFMHHVYFADERGSPGTLLTCFPFERGQEGDRVRYRTAAHGSDPGTVVDILDTNLPFGREGIGTAHHVAFRFEDETALEAWRDLLVEDGLEPTYVKDRRYFQSVYVREPGGILVELATDGPGLTVDESVESLGTGLRLPPWLEEDRAMITAQLPPVTAGEPSEDRE